jgi:outer membrane scaffolding protein for murein synthesis (MipA/OmpV family)
MIASDVRGRVTALAAWILLPPPAFAQTPSPLQEWQYSSGILLERLYEPDIPQWKVVLGAGAEAEPLYDGAQPYRVRAGPVFNIRYRDIAFASTGEGVGINVLRGANYRMGVAAGYDLGRRDSDDENHLHGLPDIPRAPVFRVFGSYVVSKDFPLVVRSDVRQSIGRGPDGMIGDIGAYMPIPGSSEHFVLFAGPSVTIASRQYLDKRFGVTASQSPTSGFASYRPRAGVTAAGLGVSSTTFITDRLMINVDGAMDWLLHDARGSPLTQRSAQPALAISIAYMR